MDEWKAPKIVDSIRACLQKAGIEDAEVHAHPSRAAVTVEVPLDSCGPARDALGLRPESYDDHWEIEGEIVYVSVRPEAQAYRLLGEREDQFYDRLLRAGFPEDTSVGSCFDHDGLKWGEWEIMFDVRIHDDHDRTLEGYRRLIEVALPEMSITSAVVVPVPPWQPIDDEMADDLRPIEGMEVDIVIRECGDRYSLPG